MEEWVQMTLITDKEEVESTRKSDGQFIQMIWLIKKELNWLYLCQLIYINGQDISN